MKLQSCLSILQCSILADGIVDLQRKCKLSIESQEHDEDLAINSDDADVDCKRLTASKVSNTSEFSWNF